jgi:dipeptidyl aminopeptidase/acylaminoacyl peptidase
MKLKTVSKTGNVVFMILFWLFQPTFSNDAKPVFSPEDVLNTRYCSDVVISPNGNWIAFAINRQRDANDEPGSNYKDLYIYSLKENKSIPYIIGKESFNSLQWKPDSSALTFLAKRKENTDTQIWQIPIAGGEAVPLTQSETDVEAYAWSPNGQTIAFAAKPAKTGRQKTLEKKGYDFIFYEENIRPAYLYLLDLSKNHSVTQLTNNMTVFDFVFSPNSSTIAAGMSQENLIDHRYMFRKVYAIDMQSKRVTQLTDNPGKLGNYEISPDGKKLVYTAALERKDHAVSQLFLKDLTTNKTVNLTLPHFAGHVNNAYWKDNQTIFYTSGEGVWSTLREVAIKNPTHHKIVLHAKDSGIIFRHLSFSTDKKMIAFFGSSPNIPGDVFLYQPKIGLKQLTDVNPWIRQRTLGKQEVFSYQARDGLTIEGILIYPPYFSEEQSYPMIFDIHGGPESHHFNNWVTDYASPAQVMAGKGYLVFFPNYRASTGYGVKFALEGFADPAGKEFDDIADGIEFVVNKGWADAKRIGLGGGSYGGYAAAWFATYYTRLVKAVCMFVGISNIISKRGTTDIPYEELYVHAGSPLEECWDQALKRSPIYYAHQSKTAVLILGGADDTRVHPAQSLEMFRRLKMNNHPAVRLVQYPKEGHGNRRQPGRIDLLYRTLQWYDWYVKDNRPITDPMPPLDISDCYGLKFEE